MATLVYWVKDRIATLDLDVALSEQHDEDLKVTDHPVEEGSPITDHAAEQPHQLTLEGLYTNTPLRADDRTRQVAGLGEVADVAESQRAFVQGQAVPGRAELAYADLRDLRAARQVVSVVTQLRVYQDMVITKLSSPRDSKTGDAVRFTVSLRQVRQVRTQRVQVPMDTPRKPKKHLGEHPAKPTPPAVDKSGLKNLAESFPKLVSSVSAALGGGAP